MLGAAFDYKLPSKETFLSDAEKRFQMLSNSIDEFTEKSAVGKEVGNRENDDEDDVVEIDQAISQITSQAELQRMYREAVMLYNAGKYEEALLINEELVQKEPENARYNNCLGVILYEMKHYQEALKVEEKAIELEPDNAQYRHSFEITKSN